MCLTAFWPELSCSFCATALGSLLLVHPPTARFGLGEYLLTLAIICHLNITTL